MNSVVTQRFIECIEALKRDNKVRSARQFALSLDYLPQGLSEMYKGRRDVTIELIRKAAETYHINPAYLFLGTGQPFTGRESVQGMQVLTIVTDRDNNERIVHVPVAAQAGYTQQLADPAFVQDLPTYSLPDDSFQSGSYRSFDISGSSMEPTLYHGDRVVCSFIEPQYWQQAIKNGHVYVIVTPTDVLIKRLTNRLRQDGCIDLISDNAAFRPQQVSGEDIREVWWARLKITPYLNKPATLDISQDLEDQIIRQGQLIEQLSRTLEHLNGRQSA